MSYVFKGFPSNIVTTDSEDIHSVKVEEGIGYKSKPTLLTGNVTNHILLSPTNGNKLRLKAITIIAEGVTGTIKVYRSTSSTPIMVAYLSAQNRASTSGAFNMILGVGEYVYVTTTGIGTKETFIGISYDEGKVT